MIFKGKKTILVASSAFILGVFAESYHAYELKPDLADQQYKLFDTEEKIISVSDHAFVEMTSCYENPSCNLQKSGEKIENFLKYRKKYEKEKTELISAYPMLVSQENRQIYTVK
jgi:hypothetical protein